MQQCIAMRICISTQCKTLIRVDKLAGSTGGQVNAFHCSSTHYQLREGYLEFALKIQCVLPAFSMRFQREFDKYKNVGDRVSVMMQEASMRAIHFVCINNNRI